MAPKSIFFFVIVSTSILNTEGFKSERNGKFLSLFSIVQFKNSPCISSSSNLNGTCYTASECSSNGGSAGGNCAAGFGVCCVFQLSNSGTVSQNNSYLRNPGYPSAYTSSSAVAYTVNKVSQDICTLRLDFNTFVIVGPQSGTVTTFPYSPEVSPLCPDSFTVTVTSGQTIPKICGINTGQHIYVQLGNEASASATLNFAFASGFSSTTRKWDIQVSQITCSSITNPPSGCLQYHYSLTGRITTFNFADKVGGHLDNQQYSICIRQEMGYCCVSYQVCPDETNAFSLSAGNKAVKVSLVDTKCNTLDYILIDGASSLCTTQGVNLYSRFCGSYFTTDASAAVDPPNIPICDCSAPFIVGIYTNALSDNQSPSSTMVTPNDAFSRGLCLDFMQVPC